MARQSVSAILRFVALPSTISASFFGIVILTPPICAPVCQGVPVAEIRCRVVQLIAPLRIAEMRAVQVL
jgi:hypothetical protein